MKRLEVRFVNGSCAYISGYGSRELITEIRKRPPCWSSLGRAWVTTPRTARDIIAVAEARHYEVFVTEGDPVDLSRGRLW